MGLTALLAVGCGNDCTPKAGEATAFATLDQWCQVKLVNGDVAPESGVTPYSLNTPLFSDYAIKRRTVWMPSGVSATYDATGVFTFPDGTVFTKSFGFPDDLRKVQPTITWVETRVVWKTAGVWQGITYTWDSAQKTATANPGGGVVPLSFIDANGNPVSPGLPGAFFPAVRPVPQQQRGLCAHRPQGPEPQSRQPVPKRQYPEPARLLERQGPPHGSTRPLGRPQAGRVEVTRAPGRWSSARGPTWKATAPIATARRAKRTRRDSSSRRWRPTPSVTASASIRWPRALAVAVGPSTMLPGDPSQSIIPCRLESTEPSIAMPQIGRSVVDTQGLQLVTDWISCAAWHLRLKKCCSDRRPKSPTSDRP